MGHGLKKMERSHTDLKSVPISNICANQCKDVSFIGHGLKQMKQIHTDF